MSTSSRGGVLFRGEATVKKQVGNLPAELSLRDWVQAVILACETGMVVPGDPAPGTPWLRGSIVTFPVTHCEGVRLRRSGDRLGPWRAEGGDRGCQARASGRGYRAQGHAWRRLSEHR